MRSTYQAHWLSIMSTKLGVVVGAKRPVDSVEDVVKRKQSCKEPTVLAAVASATVVSEEAKAVKVIDAAPQTTPTASSIDEEPFFFYGHRAPKDGGIGRHVFSQWWPCTFTEAAKNVVAPVMYHCTEQYMMAAKARLFGDGTAEAKIMASTNPRVHKQFGRRVKGFDAGTWDRHKFTIVVRANWLKFTQNKEFGDYLLSTSNRLLVEASPSDTIWGIGMTEAEAKRTPIARWRGQNLLGKALVEVRKQLQQSKGSDLVVTTTTVSDTTTAT